ncbi:MAG: hypothetical protein ACHQX3_00235, partial [Nitrospirales bacterium]
MSLLTYAEAKQSRELADISGVCSGGEAFRNLLNQGTRKLMRRGSWFGTVQKIRNCIRNNCVVWPRQIGTVLATNICGIHVPQKDFWASFLPMQSGEWEAWGLSPDFRGVPCAGNVRFENVGTTSVVAQPQCGVDAYIRSYPSTQADVGKKITWFGIDDNGQVIRTVQDGVLQEGVVVTLALPFATTPFKIRRVDRAVKQVTQGVVRNYYYDGTNLWDCSVYDPNETSPSYNFSKFVGCLRGGSCPTAIDALVKLEYIPVVSNNDLVLIDNLDALQLMMFSIKNLTSKDIDAARQLELDAFREQNY